MSRIKVVLLATFYAGIVMVLVYGETRTLNGTEGNDMVLPDKLLGSGSLKWRGSTPLVVVNGLKMYDFHSRVKWNNSTGEITIKSLQKNDTGELILNVINSEAIIYHLTVHNTPQSEASSSATPPLSPTAAPAGNQLWWLILVPVLVLVLVLVLAGLWFRFGPHRRRNDAIQQTTNGDSAADSTPTANGKDVKLPMIPAGDGAAENVFNA